MTIDIGFTVGMDQNAPDWSRWSRDMDLLQDLGANTIRTGFTPWFNEPVMLDHVERCFQDAKSRGLTIMITTPQLANNSDMPKEQAIVVGSDYVKGLATRFAQYGKWWQVLNEHDAASWLTQESLGTVYHGDTKTYSVREGMTTEYLEGVRDVLSLSRGYIQDVNPECQVGTAVTGVAVDTNCEKYIWRPFYDVVSPAVDYLGINGYPMKWEQMYVELPARLRRTSIRYDKPVVLAECGIPSNGDEDEQECMEWISKQIFRASRTTSVTGIFSYMLQDRGTNHDEAEDNFGVYHYDRTPKDGWRTVRNTIKSILEV